MSERGKAVIIVPGRRESVHGKSYKRIGDLFQHNSIKPIYIQPDWKLKSVSKMLTDTTSKINESIKNNYDQVYGFGFSLGAMFSLISSSQLAFKKSVLCSMSFFQEEIPYMGTILKIFTKKMIYGGEEAFTYPEIASQQKCIFVYGEKELKSIPKTLIEARSNKFPGEVVIAEKAGHNISHSGYQKALELVIANM